MSQSLYFSNYSHLSRISDNSSPRVIFNLPAFASRCLTLSFVLETKLLTWNLKK